MTTPTLDQSNSFLNLGLVAKLKLALRLALSKFIFYFLILLAIAMAMTLLSSIFSIFLGLPVGLFFAFLILALIVPPIGVGVAKAILQNTDGNMETGQLNAIFEPFNRFGQILPVAILWWLISLVIGFILGVIALIPILGWLVCFIGHLVLGMIILCVFFYLAEHETAPVGECIIVPVKMVLKNINCWISYIIGAILAYLPTSILIGVAVAIIITSTGVAATGTYENTSVLAGVNFFSIFIIFIGILLSVVATVYSFFLAAISYRQSLKSLDQQEKQESVINNTPYKEN